MIHPKAGKSLTLESLKKVRVHRPEGAGPHWRPVPHHELLGALCEGARARGWRLNNLQCALSNDGANLAASLDAVGAYTGEGWVCSVGVTNSHSQRERIWLYAGLRLLAADVGIPLDRLSLGRHTTYLRLDDQIRDALEWYAEISPDFPDRVARLRTRRLPLARAQQLLLKAAGAGYLSDSRAARLQRKLQDAGTPPVEWDLLVDVAQLTRKAPPLKQMFYAYSFLTEILEPRS